MVATVGRMASDSYYLEAQKTWRPGERAGGGGLFPVGDGGPDGAAAGPGSPGGVAGEGGGATDYYVGGEEPDGAWWNPGGILGLEDRGAVDARDFRRLYHGFHPETGEGMVKNSGSEKRCPGLDMTFSADKSVSALWAIADEDLREEIAKAHNDACRTALDEIVREHCNWTRTRPKGGDIELHQGELAGAMFQHGTSRDNDPQLHTHCLIFNLVDVGDGKMRSHYRPPIFRWQKAAGATYRNALAWNLQGRLGIRMEQYGKDGAFTRVAGMPAGLIAEWSKRRKTIAGMADDMGFATGGNAAAAAGLNKATRREKLAGQGGELRHVAWALEADDHIENREEFVAGMTGQEVAATLDEIGAARERVDRIPDDITQHEAVFRLPDIVERTMNAAAATLGPAASRASVERVLANEEVVELDMPTASVEADHGLAHTRVFSTRSEIDMEVAVGRMAKTAAADSRLAIDAEGIEVKLAQMHYEGRSLSDEQVEAIRHGAGAGSGRLAIIEGAAGAGKTTTLRPIVDLYRERGHTVLATAVAWRTAVALGNDCGVTPYSVDRLLRRVAKGTIELDDQTVIVVDEAGMLSTRQTYHLMRLAEEHGCKVIAAGDTEQHQPIGAGPGLRLMRQAAGGVRVDEIRRQLPDAEDVLTQVDGLDPETARLQAGLMSAGERREVVARYQAMEEPPDVTSWQIGVSEAIRDGRADEAMAALGRRDRLHIEKDLEVTLSRLVDDWEAWRRDNPEGVATVIARTHDEVAALSHIMRERVLGAAGGGGEPVVVQACGARSDDDRVRPLEIARGDLLRVGTLLWEKRLFNGTIVEVSDITVHGKGTDEERVEITGRSEYGDDVSFFVDEVRDVFGRVRLDHGYAMTVASSQGRTVDAAFVLADDRTARPTIYPALTRHREHLEVYVNREPAAVAVAARKPEDEQGRAVDDAEIAEHLAGAWSRDGYKVAAHDFMSPALADKVEATYPGGKGAPAWLAANDNRLGTLAGVGRAIRNATDRWRHGATVAGLGEEMRELDDEYDTLTQRWAAAGGGDADLVGAFRLHAGRQRDLSGRMAPFVAKPTRYEALWREAGDVAVQDVVNFRAGVEELDAWVRQAGRGATRSSAGAVPADGRRAAEEGGDMAIAAGTVEVPAHIGEELLVDACRAQATDRFRWLPEGRERLDQLYTQAREALAAWAGGSGEAPEEVRQFVDDYPRAVSAWDAAGAVVAGMDEIRANPASERRQTVLQAIRAIADDAGRIWHDETLRIIQRDLARRGTLLGAEAWLAAARADLTQEETPAIIPPPPSQARPGPQTAAPPRAAGSRPGARAPARPRPNPERTPLKPRLPRAGELRDALADRALDVCRTYLPAGRIAGGVWTIGNVEGDAGKSMWVNLSGPRRGQWKDGATGEWGDLLDVIQRSRGLSDFGDVLKEASAFLGGSFVAAVGSREPRVSGSADTAREIDELALRYRRSAQTNWAAALAIRAGDTDHPAARYLRRRGLDPAAAQGLRWRRQARTKVGDEWRTFPALVARIETHDGHFEGVHRIFLDEEGGKATIAGGAKRSLGPQEKGGVWFGNRSATRVVMTEGIEDAVAAIQAMPPGALENLAVVATAGGGRMHRVELPPTARELVVLKDNNEPGERAWKDVEAHHADTAIDVRRIVTEKDVNDDLLADPEGLRQRLAPLAGEAGTVRVAQKEGVTADEIRHLEGRVDVWRATAVIGGWGAADIDRMGADMERVEAALAGWPAGRGGDDSRQRLEAFGADAARARDAMRLARGLTAGVVDLMRERREVLAEVAADVAPRAAAQRFFAHPSAAWRGWTERAGRAREAVAALLAVEGTVWEEAVYSELGRRVMSSPEAARHTEGVSSDVARARYFLRLSRDEIGEVLQSDETMRRAAAGEAVPTSRMTRGGGIGYG